MSTAQQLHPSQKIRIEKATQGEVTLLTMTGVVGEGFEGRKVAESVKTSKVIANLRDVRRFASWGMAEWMNFLRGLEDRDLYLVECSSYAVNQMNLVTGLLGHSKLVSFYSPYRCGSCSEEFETLMLVPLDRAAIRDLGDSEQVCTTCGGRARPDKYPAAMCAAIAGQPVFDMDDEVVAFLRSKYKYSLVADASRFRAYRRVGKGSTYLRLSGNLAALPTELVTTASEGTTVVDLAGILFDPAELEAWRSYVTAVLPKVTSLQLLDCPPGFIEQAILPEDLQSKLKVRTFALSYHCESCNTLTSSMLDVAANLEQLTEGTVPTTSCPTCKSPLAAILPEQATRLPAREHDAALDKFVVKARGELADKLENCLVARPAQAPAAPATSSRAMYIAAALAVLIVGALAAVAYTMWTERREQVAAVPDQRPVVTPQPGQTFERPDWIVSSVPSSAFCHEMLNRLVCVGVSSYRPTRPEAVEEANDAALEELVNAIGLKIEDPFFKGTVVAGYSEPRAKALTALQGLDIDRTSDAYKAAVKVVRDGRKRVVELLRRSGGAAVPAQRSDWYWEEYAVEKGTGTELLVFVRYDVALDAVKALVDRYAVATPLLGSSVVTAFPALAWRDASFTGGVMLTAIGDPLAGSGVEPGHVITAVGDEPVRDADGLARQLEGWVSGELTLAVQAGDAPPRAITVQPAQP